MQPAQSLAAVAAIVVQMTFLLHQHAAFITRKQTNRQVIGERPGRQPDGRFFSQRRCDLLFELGDRTAVRIVVQLHSGGELRQERAAPPQKPNHNLFKFLSN